MRLSPTPYVGKHAGGVVIIMGTAWSLNQIPLDLLHERQAAGHLVTIGCNRILQKYQPNYYCVAEREPYSQEIERIERFEEVRLLSETIFMGEIKDPAGLRPFDPPPFEWVAWQPTTNAMLNDAKQCEKARKGEFDAVQLDPTRKIISGANIAYCMLQWALILGARHIGLVGIDLRWEAPEQSHFWGDGRTLGCREFPRKCVVFHDACREWLRLHRNEIGEVSVRNLSPVPGPLDRVWGKEDCGEWLKRLTA